MGLVWGQLLSSDFMMIKKQIQSNSSLQKIIHGASVHFMNFLYADLLMLKSQIPNHLNKICNH